MIEADAIDTEFGLRFGDPQLVHTKFGEKLVQNAKPTEAFWAAWKLDKETLVRAGYGCGKDKKTGAWQVSLWSSPRATPEHRAEVEASRAKCADIDIPLPAGCELRPFQKAGVAYALRRKATLIADEMGLGKTVQAIAVANVTRPGTILVIVPASLLLNWRNEISRFQVLDLPIHVVSAGCPWPAGAQGWILVNYDILERYPEIKQRTWGLLICDEAHKLKNREAKRTLFVYGGRRLVTKNPKTYETVQPISAERALILTGTPILNRPAEIYTALKFLDPQAWPSASKFEARYCGAHMGGFGWVQGTPRHLDELQTRLRGSVMVRRLKSEVLTELPAKIRQVVCLDSSGLEEIIGREVQVYEDASRRLSEATQALRSAEAAQDEGAYREAVQRLREVQGIAFSEISRVRHETALAKLPQVIEQLQEVEGKCVVFAHHRDVVEALDEALGKHGGTVVVTGNTPALSRQSIVEQFQTDPKIRYFIGNIQAAGVGLTLTASSHVVFAELDWTPALVSQAEDRCHRIGQRDSVLVQHLVLDGSLDAKMAKTIIAKQTVIDQALNDQHAPQEELPTPVGTPNGTHDESKLNFEPKKNETRTKEKPPQPLVLTQEQIAAVQQALRIVAGFDTDGARQLNGVGFSRLDTRFGCDLAARNRLTSGQAAAAARMLRKYRKQYPQEIFDTIYGAPG